LPAWLIRIFIVRAVTCVINVVVQLCQAFGVLLAAGWIRQQRHGNLSELVKEPARCIAKFKAVDEVDKTLCQNSVRTCSRKTNRVSKRFPDIGITPPLFTELLLEPPF